MNPLRQPVNADIAGKDPQWKQDSFFRRYAEGN